VGCSRARALPGTAIRAIPRMINERGGGHGHDGRRRRPYAGCSPLALFPVIAGCGVTSIALGPDEAVSAVRSVQTHRPHRRGRRGECRPSRADSPGLWRDPIVRLTSRASRRAAIGDLLRAGQRERWPAERGGAVEARVLRAGHRQLLRSRRLPCVQQIAQGIPRIDASLVVSQRSRTVGHAGKAV
jgi:hypothetical protein